MADASDSKSDAGNSVWVQVPSPALTQKSRKHAIFIEKIKGLRLFLLNDCFHSSHACFCYISDLI